jgi:serine protease Do
MGRPRSTFYAGWLAGFAAALVLVALVVFGPPAFLNGASKGAGGASDATEASDPIRQPNAGQAARRGGQRDLSSLPPARQTPIVEATHRVIPSVVSVNVIRRERVAPRSIWDFWDFGNYGFEREVAGLGSGFAIAGGGYVLTNAHVVEGAVEIVVSTIDGSDHPAEMVGIDQLSDLALLKVDAELPVPQFGDSDNLVTGEPAIAIGNPFGYLLSNVEPTVTAGVISGVGRHIIPSAFTQEGDAGTIYADMIQTDASINPGNSGGPLVNAEGQVIGINSAIFSRSGGSQGLGFAIPINRARRIAEQLRTDGQVRRPWVGLDVGPAESDRTGRRRGATIVRVAPDSPADRAGLKEGTEVVAVQGRPVKSPLDWEAELLDVSPGQTINLTVRDSRGREEDFILPVEDLPSLHAQGVEVADGLELATLTPAIQAERGFHYSEGAFIVSISDEVARATELRRGDLIVAINRRRVASADEVAEMLNYLSGRGAIRVHFERDGRLYSTSFRIE